LEALYDEIPFSKNLDLLDEKEQIVWSNILSVFLIRFSHSIAFGDKVYHPDEYWQSMEIAYNMVYSDQVDAIFTWEWLPVYGLRNTIYPYYLSIPLRVLRILSIDSNMLVVNSMGAMNSII
jgi:hypothetical protein